MDVRPGDIFRKDLLFISPTILAVSFLAVWLPSNGYENTFARFLFVAGLALIVSVPVMIRIFMLLKEMADKKLGTATSASMGLPSPSADPVSPLP